MELMEAMLNRRSVRRYTDEPISEEALEQIIQAGLLAPSSRGLFPTEFIVVRDKDVLVQLSRSKTAGSGMLANASAAIVVIGDSEKSDAWIEDCSISMIYMQLFATELGIGNCWVQCRGRVSQQKKNESISPEIKEIVLNDTLSQTESLVASVIAKDKELTENMTSDEFIKDLLGIPKKYSVEAILSLGMTEQKTNPHDIPSIKSVKVHRENFYR